MHVSRLNRVYRSIGTTQAIHMHMVNTNTGLYTVYTGFTNMKRVDMTGMYRLDTYDAYLYTSIH